MPELLGATGKLGDILCSMGMTSREDLARAASPDEQLAGERLGETLIRLSLITESELCEALAAQYRLPFVRLSWRLVDRTVLEVLPHGFMGKNRVIPMFRIEDDLTIAVDDPTNLWVVDQVERITGFSVFVVVTSSSWIKSILDDLEEDGIDAFDLDEFVDQAAEGDLQLVESDAEELVNLAEVAGTSPVVRLVNYLLFKAIGDRASDIHIEPDEHVFRIRYRIDGELLELMRPPARMHAAIVSRLKVMADLDISERRLPQDGRFRVRLENRAVDVRFSTIPTVQGEKVVLRILDRSSMRINLGNLGIGHQRLQALRDLIRRPDGIVLIAGPTGSGKTTTLYAMLDEINAPSMNICTVENPVEYNLRGVNQIQANQKGGMGFPKALRSLLRQDPDVLMVGEIRDAETATLAVEASLTGHLVMATLHTNDAPSAATRLINMGIEPYLIGAALRGVVSQRLVRCLCAVCRQPFVPPPSVCERLGPLPDGQFYVGRGCDACGGAGYSGRIGVYELLVVTDDLADLISRAPSLGELRRRAQESGLMPLLGDGLAKASEGITSLDEILRVVWS